MQTAVTTCVTSAAHTPEQVKSSRRTKNDGGTPPNADARESKDIFSPRSAAAIALSAISRQTSSSIAARTVSITSSATTDSCTTVLVPESRPPQSAQRLPLTAISTSNAASTTVSSAANHYTPVSTVRSTAQPPPTIPDPLRPSPPPNSFHHYAPYPPVMYPPHSSWPQWTPQNHHHHHQYHQQQHPEDPRNILTMPSMAFMPTFYPKEVTPTPAKRKHHPQQYDRKQKSLTVLAETFVQSMTAPGGANRGRDIVIDRLAAELQVERRRIYDVINILESIYLVQKKGKNTYQWRGTERLSMTFALLQNEGIARHPEDAQKHGLKVVKNDRKQEQDQQDSTTASDGGSGSDSPASKTLSRLSQLFLQVFLVGHNVIGLPEASDIIQGRVSTVQDLAALGMKDGSVPTHPKQLQQAAARGLKTKIRRLYDIANVFMALGFLKKASDERRPLYKWSYELTPKEIQFLYNDLPAQMKAAGSPYYDGTEYVVLQGATFSKAHSGTNSKTAEKPASVDSPAVASPPIDSTTNNLKTTPPTKESLVGGGVLANINETGGAVEPPCNKRRRVIEPPRRVSLPDP